MAAFGQILNSEDDIEGIRAMLGFDASELGNEVLLHPWVLGDAERHVMRNLPNWALIMQLSAPAVPVVAAVTPPSASQLLAATYSVLLVAKVGNIPSPPGAEATQVLLTGQQLQVTIPQAPGITAYDLYVGVAAGQEYLQATLAPNQVYLLSAFSMAGQPIQQVGSIGATDEVTQGNLASLKAATQAACAAHLCKVMQRKVPRMFRSYSYSEEIDIDWRAEETAFFEDCLYHLGHIDGYISGLVPPPAARVAHPQYGPNDPSYITGTDPAAIPGALGINPSGNVG